MVVGIVTNVSLSRKVSAVPDWGEDGVLTFAAAQVQIDRVIFARDPVDSDTITWEVFVPMPGGLDYMQTGVPAGPVLLILQENPDSMASGTYMLLNPESYFVNDGGKVRAAHAAVQPWSLEYDGEAFGTLVDSVVRQAGT